jgi:hypothetical protein
MATTARDYRQQPIHVSEVDDEVVTLHRQNQVPRGHTIDILFSAPASCRLPLLGLAHFNAAGRLPEESGVR